MQIVEKNHDRESCIQRVGKATRGTKAHERTAIGYRRMTLVILSNYDAELNLAMNSQQLPCNQGSGAYDEIDETPAGRIGLDPPAH